MLINLMKKYRVMIIAAILLSIGAIPVAKAETPADSGGYVLVMPELTQNGKDCYFSLGYCSVADPVYSELGTWELGNNTIVPVYPQWLRGDRKAGKMLFSLFDYSSKDYEKEDNILYDIEISHEIKWRRYPVPVGNIVGAWQVKGFPGYVMYAAEKGENTENKFMTFDPETVNLSDVSSSEMLKAPNNGGFSSMRTTGGPYWKWTPGEKNLHFWRMNMPFTLPELPSMPPPELTAGREKSRWVCLGDLDGAFALYSNPYYYEMKNGQKTRVGIYIAAEKRWLVTELPGTECSPTVFSDWLVFDLAEMNPESRPEEFFGQTPTYYGQYLFFNLHNGESGILEPGQGASLCYAGKDTAIIDDHGTLYEISLTGITGKNYKPERRLLCQGGNLSFGTYIMPVAAKPTVIMVPPDFPALRSGTLEQKVME